MKKKCDLKVLFIGIGGGIIGVKRMRLNQILILKSNYLNYKDVEVMIGV